MITARNINREDTVFATLTALGNTINSLSGRNFTDTREVTRMICDSCKGYRGLAHLTIRNQSQGWSIKILLKIEG